MMRAVELAARVSAIWLEARSERVAKFAALEWRPTWVSEENGQVAGGMLGTAPVFV